MLRAPIKHTVSTPSTTAKIISRSKKFPTHIWQYGGGGPLLFCFLNGCPLGFAFAFVAPFLAEAADLPAPPAAAAAAGFFASAAAFVASAAFVSAGLDTAVALLGEAFSILAAELESTMTFIGDPSDSFTASGSDLGFGWGAAAGGFCDAAAAGAITTAGNVADSSAGGGRDACAWAPLDAGSKTSSAKNSEFCSSLIAAAAPAGVQAQKHVKGPSLTAVSGRPPAVMVLPGVWLTVPP
mmetsp:Transcript_134111/g.244210  ORF Transcript_134111/g.244210 Transcript_134111/m.244210 type:complete len:239 (-) Transcript_134111:93-809(-)